MNSPGSKRLFKSACAVFLGAACAMLAVARSEHSPVVSDVVSRVPAAKNALAFDGNGFASGRGAVYESDRSGRPGQRQNETVVVKAPRRAGGIFELWDAQGGVRANVRLNQAAQSSAGELENGIIAYRDAYPNVDVVAVRDAARFELGYISRVDQLPQLGLHVSTEGGSLQVEPHTGGALLRSAQGRPALRINPPIAFDGAGERRQGHYELADTSTLRIALDTRGMQPPIFIDPAFYIPYWSIGEDGRAPGGELYDERRQSRLAQIVLNGATGRPWLIRPAVALASNYFDEALGADHPSEYYSSLSGTPRTANSRAPSPPNPLLNKDFQRTVFHESETYEWRNNAWQLLPHVGLPGFVDPSIAWDSARGEMFAFGGWLHGVGAQEALTNASAVFQNDGTGWKARGFPGAPTARTRAASAAFGSKVIVFGGRSLANPQDLLNDTWAFDGANWTKLPISNPPPACESSQLVYDKRRERLVLIGGSCSVVSAVPFQPSDVDGFRLWEFDGTDWLRRFDIIDSSLPRSFQLRRGVAAAWHPLRQTTILFGGFIDVTDECPLGPTELDNARWQANTDISVRGDFTLKKQLQSQGCWGGYVHDTWEWDGATLRQLTITAYGGSDPRYGAMPVFRQVAGTIPPPSAGSDNLAAATMTKLWPWRYDSRAGHFAQRSALERTAAQPGTPNAPPVTRASNSTLAGAPSSPVTMVSPLFVPGGRPLLVIPPDTGKLLIFFPNDGRVYETDFTMWVDRTPSQTPFASGRSDFFAAAYDSARQRTVLFDPVDGVTWEHDTQGWRRATGGASPGIWTVSLFPSWLRNIHEVSLASSFGLEYPVQPPVMTFDRARGRSILLHRDALWEFDGSNWTEFATPAALKACKAASLIAFNGATNKTVVVGCSVPGQTWEWNGAAWDGPFASPFQDKVYRPAPNFAGTLQLEYAHPNALFESTTLGAVGLIDSRGTLRLWKNGTWQASAPSIDPQETQAYENYNWNRSSAITTAAAFFPPVVEDYGANRLLMFRDGIRATQELKLVPEPAPTWEDAFVGTVDAGGIAERGIATVNPFPLELMPRDFVAPQAFSDPATQTDGNGNPKVATWDVQYGNLFWSLRFLPDPVNKRVHVLTHRGVFWELGSERISDIGETCATSADCKDGAPCSQGVCCAQACNGLCLTCNGARPGKCEATAAGTPDPQNRCGAGECAGTCSGITQFLNGFPLSSCSFPSGRSCGAGVTCSNGQLIGAGTCAANGPTCVAGSPTPVPCGGGMKCADASTCKPACTSPADCQAPNQICAPDGKSCIPDGKVCRSNGDCPKFNECASDGMSCKPDAVLAAASARGVTPSKWQPEIARNPQQLADYLKSLGYRSDAQGRIWLDVGSTGSMDFLFNPNKSNPVIGFGRCMNRVNQCRFETNDLDACVAAAPRCTTDTPWLNDPGGWDCCPEPCLTDYFARRANKIGAAVMVELADGQCYPYLKEYMERP